MDNFFEFDENFELNDDYNTYEENQIFLDECWEDENPAYEDWYGEDIWFDC